MSRRQCKPNFSHPAFAAVHELGLPEQDEVVLNHSVALDIYGVLDRTPSDIDGSISSANVRYLRQEKGFLVARKIVGQFANGVSRKVLVTYSEREGNVFDFHRWDWSQDMYNREGAGRIYLSQQKQFAAQDPVTGIWVAKPEYVLGTKISTHRTIDQEDVRRIVERYGIVPLHLSRTSL